MTSGSAVAVVRLALDLDETEDMSASAFDMFNAVVADLDLPTSRVVIAELALLVAGLLGGLRDRHPGLDPNELVARWGLRLATEDCSL